MSTSKPGSFAVGGKGRPPTSTSSIQMNHPHHPGLSQSSMQAPHSPTLRHPGVRQDSTGLVSRVSLRHSTMAPGMRPVNPNKRHHQHQHQHPPYQDNRASLQEPKHPMKHTSHPPSRLYSNPNPPNNNNYNNSSSPRSRPYTNNHNYNNPNNIHNHNYTAPSTPNSYSRKNNTPYYNNNNNDNSINNNNNGESYVRSPIVVEAPLESLPWQMIGMGVMLDADDRGPAPKPNRSPNQTPPSSGSMIPPLPFQNNDYNNNNNNNNNNNDIRQPPPPPQTFSSSTLNTPPPPPPPPPPIRTIEVSPGITKPLRGSDETWKAIEDGKVTITSCLNCQLDLNCVEDAELVICPDCTMMSPVDQTCTLSDETDDNNNNNTTIMMAHRYGVGVGIKQEAIREWVRNNNNNNNGGGFTTVR